MFSGCIKLTEVDLSGVSRTQLLTVDCADQTLYYRDGQLVDRYIVQENPDGTFDYAYGTDQEYGIDYKKG